VENGESLHYSGLGISYGVVVQDAGSAIDLNYGNVFSLQFASPTTLCNFYPPGPVAGDVFVLMATNGNATLCNSLFHLASGADFTMPANVPIVFQVNADKIVREIGQTSSTYAKAGIQIGGSDGPSSIPFTDDTKKFLRADGTWQTPSESYSAKSAGAPSWLSYLGDGSGGTCNYSRGTALIDHELWCSSVNISAGAVVYNGNPGAPVVIRSTGPCTIAGTLSASPNSSSFQGVRGTAYWGGAGGGGGGGSEPGRSGFSASTFNVAPAGGAAEGGNGGSNSSPQAEGVQRLLISNGIGSFGIESADGRTVAFGGSQGGAGGVSGPSGGKGGGLIVLACQSIDLTGMIDVSGQAGIASTANNMGASGGGGGGIVILAAQHGSTYAGTINTSGGAGGSCDSHTGCGAGGAGQPGWSYKGTIQ
jgi:hypothetical protein